MLKNKKAKVYFKFVDKLQKEEKMENKKNKMNTAEILKEVIEENQTRKILEILEHSKDLNEGIKKIKELFKK